MYKILLVATIAVFITGCSGEEAKKYAINNGNEQTKTSNSPNMQAQSAIHQIPTISQSQKQKFLDAVNSARADTQDCGSEGIFAPAPALKWSDELYKAAYEHSRDMALHGIVEHYGTNTNSDWTAKDLKLGHGSHFYERVEHNGYKNYKLVEENVAGGTNLDDAYEVVDAWLKSDGHCANLMNKDITDIGMALVKENTKYTHYWTQEFGAKH
jgi:uncharacterized protein YkwD